MNDIVIKNKSLVDVGNSKGFTVPKAFIDSRQLEDGVKYDIIIRKHETEQEEIERLAFEATSQK